MAKQFINAQAVKASTTIEDIQNILEDLGIESRAAGSTLHCECACCGDSDTKLYYYETPNMHFYCHKCQWSGDIFDLLQLLDVGKSFQDRVAYVRDMLGNYNPKAKPAKVDLKAKSDISQFEFVALNSYSPKYLDMNEITPIQEWQEDFIADNVAADAGIRYDYSGKRILIPHFDAKGRLIGIKRRSFDLDEIEKYGKYNYWGVKLSKRDADQCGVERLQYVIKGEFKGEEVSKNFDLYGIDKAKHAIRRTGQAIVFESEKSVLQHRSYCGIDHSNAVAVCGHSISPYQVWLLVQCGAKEIVLAFDRTEDVHELEKWYERASEVIGDNADVSYIYDTNNLLQIKDSPTDAGKDTFEYLFSARQFKDQF